MTDPTTDDAVLISGTDGAQQYLSFTVRGELMAISILDVKEIIEISDMTRVPMTSGNIRGVINLRGNVVPVVDLAYRLSGQASHLNRRSCIVLVETGDEDERQPMGMLVERVNEILDIPETQLQQTPDFGTDIAADYIASMARYGEDFIILLNIARVLNGEDLAGTPAAGLQMKN